MHVSRFIGLSIHLLKDILLCFQLVIIMNKAAVNIHFQGFLCGQCGFSCGYLSVMVLYFEEGDGFFQLQSQKLHLSWSHSSLYSFYHTILFQSTRVLFTLVALEIYGNYWERQGRGIFIFK